MSSKTCKHCAFFIRTTQGFTSNVPSEERECYSKGDEQSVRSPSSPYAVECYRGYWTEGAVCGDNPQLTKSYIAVHTCRDFVRYDPSDPGKLLQAYVNDLTHLRQRRQFIWTVLGTLAAVVSAVTAIVLLLKPPA